MKTTFTKFLTVPLALALFSSTFVPVLAQYDDIFSGSPYYEDIYSGSPSYEDIFSGSPSYQDVYSTPSYNYTPGYDYTPSYSYIPSYDYTPSYNYTTPTYTTSNYTYPTYTTPTYTTSGYTYPTYTYSNDIGSTNYTYPTYTYPTNTNNTIPVTTNTVCSDGRAPVNGSCVRTNTIPVTTNTICSDGRAPVNGSCVRPNTIIPIVTNTVCSDGQAPINGSCTRTNTIPTNVQTVCSDGSYPINGSCTRVITTPTVTYQTCWDGTTIPLYSVCPSQYKVCANGTSIPVNQTCYYGNNYVPYTPPQVVKFNNVITSVTTEITKSSARCNGIGLIASGAQSTGWFEYGETSNLGRETAKANIGTLATAPFSNVLTNLKVSTTYYCRAVMQNQYGTVKGEIVAFTTKANAVAYVQPVTKTTVKTVSTKTATKTNQIVCTDGSIATVGSKSSADLINAGQKLVSLQIVKTSGTLAPGATVNYQLTFKNLSDEALHNLVFKVTVPAELTLTNASAGNFDQSTHVLTVNVPTLGAYADGSINWTGTVNKDATVGKSVAMTAYTNYGVPGSTVQDEVTAYVVGTVVPATDNASSTGAKGVIGGSDDRGFLPNTLVEWLALIAIIFIIFVLGRSVYTSYSNDRKASH
ncbi:MAG: hypothetical protein ACAH17_00455 [Candidatus Paceibacterota bacterium]